jgi:exodeoxyribonuclease VIII
MIAPTFTPEPGQFYDGVPNEVYHAGPGWSSSQLKLIPDWSPLYFKESLNAPRVPTPSMLRGSAGHCAVLERHNLDRDFAFLPKGTRKTSAEYQAAVAEGKTVVTQETREEIIALADGVLRHKAWRALAGPEPICERSFYWTDERTGLLLRCRPDAMRVLDIDDGLARITDLKFVADPRPHAFTRQVKSLGYDFSAAMYCAGVEAVLGIPCQYLWIAARAKGNAVAVYDAAPWLPQARETYHRTLGTLAECERTGVYPDLHGERVVALERPIWAQNDGENDE